MKPVLLITGASGFLGRAILQRARTRWNPVAVHCASEPAEYRLFWVKIDLTRRARIRELVRRCRPRVIIHAAALSDLDRCEHEPGLAHKINVEATRHLAECAAENGSRLLFISSDMVFNGRRGLYREEDDVSPLSVYGRTKVQAEKTVSRTLDDHLIVRAALIYGRSASARLSFSDWIEQRLINGKRVPLYTDQFRSPIYVGNLADLLLQLAQDNIRGLLHLGGAERINRLDFGLKMCEHGNYDPSLLQPTVMPDNGPGAARPRDVSLCVAKARRFTDRLLTVDQGLKRLFTDEMRGENE